MKLINPGTVVIIDGQLAMITEANRIYQQTSSGEHTDYFSGYYFDGSKFTDHKGAIFEAHCIEEWHNKEIIRERENDAMIRYKEWYGF